MNSGIDKKALAALDKYSPIPAHFNGGLLPLGPTVQDVLHCELFHTTNNNIDVAFTAYNGPIPDDIIPFLSSTAFPSVARLNDYLRQAVSMYEMGVNDIGFTYRYDGPDGVQIPLLLPSWMLAVWALRYQLLHSQSTWTKGLTALNTAHPDIASTVVPHIIGLPWNLVLPNELVNAPNDTIEFLARFCHNDQWLAGTNVNQMITLIRRDLQAKDIKSVDIVWTDFFESLTRRYARRAENEGMGLRHLPNDKLGKALACGDVMKLIMIINVKLKEGGEVEVPENDVLGNHWMTVVIQVDGESPIGFHLEKAICSKAT